MEARGLAALLESSTHSVQLVVVRIFLEKCRFARHSPEKVGLEKAGLEKAVVLN